MNIKRFLMAPVLGSMLFVGCGKKNLGLTNMRGFKQICKLYPKMNILNNKSFVRESYKMPVSNLSYISRLNNHSIKRYFQSMPKKIINFACGGALGLGLGKIYGSTIGAYRFHNAELDVKIDFQNFLDIFYMGSGCCLTFLGRRSIKGGIEKLSNIAFGKQSIHLNKYQNKLIHEGEKKMVVKPFYKKSVFLYGLLLGFIPSFTFHYIDGYYYWGPRFLAETLHYRSIYELYNCFLGKPQKLSRTHINRIYRTNPHLKNDPNFKVKKYRFIKNIQDGSCHLRIILLKILTSIVNRKDFDELIDILENKSKYYTQTQQLQGWSSLFAMDPNYQLAISKLRNLKNKNVLEIIDELNDPDFDNKVLEQFCRSFWYCEIINNYINEYGEKDFLKKLKENEIIDYYGIIPYRGSKIRSPKSAHFFVLDHDRFENCMKKCLSLSEKDISISTGHIIAARKPGHKDIVIHISLLK